MRAMAVLHVAWHLAGPEADADRRPALRALRTAPPACANARWLTCVNERPRAAAQDDETARASRRAVKWSREHRGFTVPRVSRTKHALPADLAVEAAIARVLAAEVAARAALEDAQRQAAEEAEAARATARTIAQRTTARIAVVRAAFARKVAGEIAALDGQADALAGAHALTTEEIAGLERALAALTRELFARTA